MVGAAFSSLAFSIAGDANILLIVSCLGPGGLVGGTPPLARCNVINDLAKKYRVFDCPGAKVRQNKKLAGVSSLPGRSFVFLMALLLFYQFQYPSPDTIWQFICGVDACSCAEFSFLGA
jgi:hypothetical protein